MQKPTFLALLSGVKSTLLVVFLLALSYPGSGQQRVPVFGNREDSLAYQQTMDKLTSALRNPRYTARIDSLMRVSMALREKAVRYRTMYVPSFRYDRWNSLPAHLDSVKRVTLVDYPGKELPDSLLLLTNLEDLELINTRIRKIPSSLSSLKSLKKISLLNNRPRGRVKFGKLPNVQTIVINDDELDRRPRSYRKLKNLQLLDLSRNNLTRFPRIRGKQIKHLFMIENHLTQIEVKGLPALEELNLTSNAITEIPASIGELTNLRKINLNLNQVANIAPEIGRLQKLEQLFLYKNQVKTLPKEIYKLSNLKAIDLYYNQLDELNPLIANWKQLEILYVSNNLIYTLPDNLGELRKLRELYLHHNRISNLPASLGNLDSLRVLRVNNNNLVEFPKSLLSLKSLENLDMASNQLPEVPEALFSMPALKIISLNQNPFEPVVLERLLTWARRAMQQRPVVIHMEGIMEPGTN